MLICLKEDIVIIIKNDFVMKSFFDVFLMNLGLYVFWWYCVVNFFYCYKMVLFGKVLL